MRCLTLLMAALVLTTFSDSVFSLEINNGLRQGHPNYIQPNTGPGAVDI